MARLIQLDLRPSRRTLRQFGLFALLGLGLLALMAFREAGLFARGLGVVRLPLVYGLGGLGLLSAVFSLVSPKANLPMYVGVSLIAYPLGVLLSFAIMVLLFFVVFGIVALALRLRGRDPLARAPDPTADSYWSQHRSSAAKDRYFRQF